ncbi:hypothetical protein HB999_07530 [Listeria booriae]|uniref:hypothetical protein n=1 Tax=Listeria booriae TaxID=1552123 RepID=UPI00164D228F|nr:hypothetical protein [Listeria booriae]MBC6163317.1 hypothetical protein [Listeria booriae]
MRIDQFLTDLKNVIANYEEDAQCELSFELVANIVFDDYEKQQCDETEHFEGVEYIRQIQVFEDYFEGTIIREIKGSVYCVIIGYSN